MTGPDNFRLFSSSGFPQIYCRGPPWTLLFYSVWLSISVQPLCSFQSIICTVSLHTFVANSCNPSGWRLQPTRVPRELVSRLHPCPHATVSWSPMVGGSDNIFSFLDFPPLFRTFPAFSIKCGAAANRWSWHFRGKEWTTCTVIPYANDVSQLTGQNLNQNKSYLSQQLLWHPVLIWVYFEHICIFLPPLFLYSVICTLLHLWKYERKCHIIYTSHN